MLPGPVVFGIIHMYGLMIGIGLALGFGILAFYFKKKGIDKDIFERLKRASFASSLRAFNSTEDVANDLMVHVFTGYDMLKYPELIASVTYEDVCARLENGFAENAFVLSTIYPKTKR